MAGSTPRSPLRTATLVIGVAEMAMFAALAALMLQSTDPLGRAIGEGLTKLMAIPAVVLVVPGVVLGWLRRFVPLAFALVVSAIPVAAVLWKLA